MTRQRKHKVDYFPHQVTHGRTMFVLENKFGNDGYACWFKTLETIGDTEGHFIDLNNPADMEFLAAKMRISVADMIDIYQTLSVLGGIDADLWEYGIIWSQHFLDGLNEVYRKRKIEPPQKPALPTREKTYPRQITAYPRQESDNRDNQQVGDDEIQSATEKPLSATVNRVVHRGYPQRKEEERKEEKSIGQDDIRDRKDFTEQDSQPAGPSEKTEQLQESPAPSFSDFDPPKPETPKDPPQPRNGNGTDRLKDIVSKIATRNQDLGFNRQVMRFIEQHYGRSHPDAIMHCLNSLHKQLEAGEEIKVPFQYLEAAMKIENGKYNARDHERAAEEYKKPGMMTLADIMSGALAHGVG